jgi:hypothetical protein
MGTGQAVLDAKARAMSWGGQKWMLRIIWQKIMEYHLSNIP